MGFYCRSRSCVFQFAFVLLNPILIQYQVSLMTAVALIRSSTNAIFLILHVSCTEHGQNHIFCWINLNIINLYNNVLCTSHPIEYFLYSGLL